MLQFWLGWPNLPQHGYGHRNRRQWITKLVRENREELILPSVGFSKRLLGTPALADISKHEHDAGGRRCQQLLVARERVARLHHVRNISDDPRRADDVAVMILQWRDADGYGEMAAAFRHSNGFEMFERSAAANPVENLVFLVEP